MLQKQINQYCAQEKGDDIARYLENYKFEIEGERALWQSVIMQAVLDLQIKADNLKQKIKRAETLKWFSKQDQDFMFVCSMAELDPDMLIKGAREVFKKYHKSFKRMGIAEGKGKGENIADSVTIESKKINQFN